MSLDKDLATIGRLYYAGWQEWGTTMMAREEIGRRRWFMRCCGKPMNVLLEFSVAKGTEHLHPGSLKRMARLYQDCSICLQCGHIIGNPILKVRPS